MINTKLEQHVFTTEHTSVQQICAPLSEIGINGFIFMRQFPDGKFVDLATQMEWGEFFLEKFLAGEYTKDTVANHMFMRSDVNLWVSNPNNEIWIEGQQLFGFGNGVSIANHHQDYSDVFCFYSDADDYQINETYLRNFSQLKLFADYFVDRAQKLIKKGEKNPLQSPRIYLSDDVDSEHCSNNSGPLFVDISPFGKLSKREMDCLRLLVDGKSAKQIGDLLFISPRTVEGHLKKAKEKLNCSTLAQLSSMVVRYLFV